MSSPQPEVTDFRWVPIKDWPRYWVHPDGFVMSDKKEGLKILRGKITPFGYHRMALSVGNVMKNFMMHRLVAEAFIPNPESKKEVNHKNGIKTDNRIVNLEWTTPSENVRHRFDVLGHKSNALMMTDDDVIDIWTLRIFGARQVDLMEAFQVSKATIYRICRYHTQRCPQIT